MTQHHGRSPSPLGTVEDKLVVLVQRFLVESVGGRLKAFFGWVWRF